MVVHELAQATLLEVSPNLFHDVPQCIFDLLGNEMHDLLSLKKILIIHISLSFSKKLFFRKMWMIFLFFYKPPTPKVLPSPPSPKLLNKA